MKKYLIIILCLYFTSCDGLLDVNVDPGRISPDQVTVQTLLPASIRFTASTIYGAAQYGAQYPQYLQGQGISQYIPYGFDQIWRPLYTDALPSLQEIIERAEAQQAYNYSGAAKVMLGLSMMTGTDIFGALPYTEANRGTTNLYPCYDSMQELYEVHLPALINGAIEDLQRPLPELPSLRVLRGDYIYGGDQAKWLKAAYALRARYNLHMAEKNPALLADAVQDAERAFTANADDFQLIFEEQVQNPWFLFIGNAPNKIMRPGAYITDLMSGAAAYPGVMDPRINFYMSNGSASTFVGIGPGFLIGDEPGVNVDLTANTWHSTNSAPLQMMTYPEIQFIKAEAQITTNPNAAYDAYLEGIRASMAKVGVSNDAITSYLASPAIAVGAGNLTLSNVMLQKYIALYLQIETWTDMRRYQYDPTVYLGLEMPSGNRNQLPGGGWIQRSNIPDDEPATNTCLPEILPQNVPLWLFEN